MTSLLIERRLRKGEIGPERIFVGCFPAMVLLFSFLFRLLQLQEQMRALYKAISVPRVRRASSKGGGGYTCQSGSGWDEFTKRLTSECLGWMRQQRVSSGQGVRAGPQCPEPMEPAVQRCRITPSGLATKSGLSLSWQQQLTVFGIFLIYK